MPGVQIDRPLFLTADGENLVEAGDPRAATAWAIEGSSRSTDEAERLGYKPMSKSARQPANKSVSAPVEDKAEDLTCDECGKVAKSAGGLAAHKRSHD